MADNFYRVTKNEDIYTKDFEELLNFYDLLSIMGPHTKEMTLHNEDGERLYLIKEKPNTKDLYIKYNKYINAINANENIVNKDGTINKEILLHTLADPLKSNPERNANIMQKINSYFSAQKAEVKTKPEISSELKKEFQIELARNINLRNVLPNNYVKELGEIILETFSKEDIEEYTLNPTSRDMFSNEILHQKCSKENLKRLNRIQHALESAIATELVTKGGDKSLFGESIDTLIAELENQEVCIGQRHTNKIDIYKIKDLYNEYKKDLTQQELIYMTNGYFVSKAEDQKSTREEEKMVMDYISEYGKGASLLFNGDMSFSIIAKTALNDKFLRLMPPEIKDIAKPLLQTKEDMEREYNIEAVRRRIAKKLNMVPQEPRNIYTIEAANLMRLLEQPDADRELKENYDLEGFKKSLSKEDLEEGEITSILKFPKYCITNNLSKIKLLAVEQAMADELFRVSNNDIVYKYEIEDLTLWFELSSKWKKGNPDGLRFSNADNDDGFIIKAKPNKENILHKYLDYVKEMEEREGLFNENGELDREEILCCLNPDENLKERDKYTKERIDQYFKD